MKRFLSFLYFLPSSLMLMAGDRLPGSSKPWSVQFCIVLLVIGIIVVAISLKNQKESNQNDDTAGTIGVFMVFAGIMGLVSSCIASVAS